MGRQERQRGSSSLRVLRWLFTATKGGIQVSKKILVWVRTPLGATLMEQEEREQEREDKPCGECGFYEWDTDSAPLSDCKTCGRIRV